MALSILTVMPDPAQLRRIVDERLPAYLAELERLVNIDCGSYTAEGVNRIADHVGAALRELGADVERIPHEPDAGGTRLGDLVIGRIRGRRSAAPPHRAHGHGVRPGDRGRATVSSTDGRATGSRE